jgi:acetyl esterase
MRGEAEAALDPQVRRLLRALSLRGSGAAGAEVARRRAAFRELMGFCPVDAHVAHVAQTTFRGPAGALAARLYTPPEAPPGSLPGLVFFHGGGLIAGDLDTHDGLCRALSAASGCRVIAPEYRLAPEHPCPAAVEDAEAAARWVIDSAEVLGVDPARLVIGGDSAGGTLAAAVCRRMGQGTRSPFALQLLLCPILDWSTRTPSRRELATGYLLDGTAMAEELGLYLAGQTAPEHPDVSPLRASDFGAQPRAIIHTAAFDPLRDEGRLYAERLHAAGVEVGYTCHPGMIHLFYALGQVVPYAHAALRQIGADVRAALA